MRLAALVALTLAACAPSPSVGTQRAAVGEQQNGFPSAWERALFMAANRARSDPSTVKGAQSAILPAQPPLVVDYDLERSSRFHATMLETGQAPLMHPSPCTLAADAATSGCDGSPSCGCQGGKTCMTCGTCAAGTDPFARIGMFRPGGGGGEVAAAGYGDPWAVMDGWVDEAAGADGHRQIVDGASYGVAGFGHASGTAGACWPTFDVGDFAFDKPAPAKLASAAPKPIGGGAGTYRIYATWVDADGAPSVINAVVDGACTAMTRELGSDALNATYYADVPLGAGCHAVYVLARDAAGARVSYPSTTAFTIDAGAGNCTGEVTQPQAACDGEAPPDLGGTGGGDASGNPNRNGNPSGNPNGNPSGNPSGDPNGNTPLSNPSAPNGSIQGGCAVAPGDVASAVTPLVLLSLALGAVRTSTRRRRR